MRVKQNRNQQNYSLNCKRLITLEIGKKKQEYSFGMTKNTFQKEMDRKLFNFMNKTKRLAKQFSKFNFTHFLRNYTSVQLK